ncbi:MAG: response regulator [Gemmatimonadaceae bacterium]|nr:response regulator [Gemmatimonadaceae bacterium]NUO95887.1 response regulator [Gemmatimonadaceae bacterium]NUP54536.1 response regulator [Gemmatimonadaceae bacterium]NUP69664.1 response regulator [Gemmatimonadaceae bacterium]NUR34255.1 response regulator [Gemmatimonadaceae bacterium]
MNKGQTSGGALVLVVERDPYVRELEAFFLNDAGYSVDFVADGVAALAAARERKPAIVVTEILVPQLDGLALCRAIKSDPTLASTVVLVFSILAAHGRAREAGADAFLMKPLAERQLVQTVRDLLASRAGRDASWPKGAVQ